MKKVYEAPKMECQEFIANEFVATCGLTNDGTWLISGEGVIEELTAFKRTPAGIADYLPDDELSEEHTIYRGSFYREDPVTGELHPDATNWGHQNETEDYGIKTCCQGTVESGKQMWGFHYDFVEYTNHS